MHASWNQWTGSVAPQVPSYGTAFSQGAAPPATPFSSVNPFQVTSTPSVTTPAVTTSYQPPIYAQPPPPPQPTQTPQQQQQWQQWEQWQQQYAQWHQQYGDKYQGPLPTSVVPPAIPTMPYSSMPPLPPGAPTAQPPPPDTVPPPSADKNDTDAGKRASQDVGKEETKKQKTGKGKSETVEDLVEQEKTFDEQFKSWETSFIKWKEQNANHPDKTQYKEYEAKWESWREQLIQKREQLRKKRETKEAEVAAAAAAAKEAALATSSNTAGYSTAAATQSNPYLASSMMYPMASMYATQGMSQMAGQAQNFMPSYPLYNMPPPTSMPPLPMMPPVAGHDQQKEMDSSKTNQSLEFLTSSSSSATNAKSIPGLDLVGSDKPGAPPAVSSIAPTSSLFSYNQDVTKPLHTSDDKPFNFPAPPQSNNYNYNDQARNQYSSFSLSRPPPSLPPNQNRFQKNYSYDQRNEPNDFSEDRNRFEDKFGNRPGGNTKFDNYGPPVDSRNEPALDKGSKFGNTTYTPSFNSEKYAKYYEDEYDDSRFRDPEPESPQRNASKFNNYGRNDRDGFSNFRQNNFGNRGGFSNKFDNFQRDFNDPSNNRQEMGRGRGKFGARPPFGDGNNLDSQNSFNNRYGGFGRGQSNDNSRPNFNSWQSNDPKAPPERFDNAEMDKPIPGKPVSLLDLPMIKPPDSFDNKPFGDETSGPFDSDKGPLGSDKGPFGSDKVPFGGDKGPFGGDKGSFTSDKAPFGGDRGSFGGDKGSFTSDKPPFGSNRGPFGVDKGPFGGDKGPFGSDKGPFGGDKGPFGSDRGPDGISKSDDSRFGLNVPPPFKGPPFGNFDDSRLGPKNSNSLFDGPNGRSAPDLNKFPSQGSFPPPKSLPNASDLKSENSAGGGDKPAPTEAILEDLIPSLLFDYQHFKKTSAESLPSSFDAVYIFDYGHGKKKAVDNKDFIDSLASEVKANDKNTWEGEPWQDEKKSEEKVEPLPQRTKANTDLTKELAAILNKSEKPKEDQSNDVDEKKSSSAPWRRETPQEALAKKDEPMEIESITTAPTKAAIPESTLITPNSKLIDDLLLPPGRHSRPIKLVIVMRGPPGSGKTFTAKLIKDKEVEMGGSAPRILSLDDYFNVENDVEETDPSTGKKITKKEMVYEYEAEMEPSYQDSLVKSFKKTVSDGFFPFIIIDCINDKVKKYEEMYSFALSKGFQVFVCEMDVDLSTCAKRNIHSRTEEEIKKLIDGWEKTPPSQTPLDIRSLLQSAAITEVDMADAEEPPPKEEPPKEVEKPEQKNDEKEKVEPAAETTEPEKPTEEEVETPEKEGFSSYMDILCTSKWEKSENTEEKLDRLDGVSKKRSSTTFKEWLQLPEDETDLSWYASNDKTTAVASESNVPRKKRVRWADLEERVAQQKMRAIGFVVGQTDWKRMMDPSFGGSKLTQTKYIYK